MCKHTVEKIYDISEKCNAKQIAIITNHLKILGTLYQDENIDYDEHLLTLTNTKLWRLGDICTCKEADCRCDEATFCSLEWLHVNVSKIIAFSLVKDEAPIQDSQEAQENQEGTETE